MTRYVIVGAGEAGIRAAASLRAAGEREIVVLSAEPIAPYERPPLSKPPDPDRGLLRPIGVDLSGVELRLGCSARAIDRRARTVELATGERIPYDRLLLATGAKPRRLACPGGDRALLLRSSDDARAIHARAEPGARAVIVGAGLIGLELAATLRVRGLEVCVVELAARALGRAVPAELAERLVERHRAEGVLFLFGARLEAVEAGAVRLADGTRLPADLVVAAIGVEPATELAEAADLACANGILVDSSLRTSDPAIFAAGDCAAVDHPRYGRVRFESWRMAGEQGRLAGRTMRGEAGELTALPWFWSDQWDLSLQVVGRCDPQRQAVLRALGSPGLVRFELDPTGGLAAAAALGPAGPVGRAIRLVERLIERGAVVPPSTLADPEADLRPFLRAP
ncbi:MAG: FAD-dependent oxidoreductase [Geminicoccaceae bacterium]